MINLISTRALSVIKSDNALIPYPAPATSGTSTGVSVNELVDNTKDFQALRIEVGNIVYNTTSNKAATVVQNPSSLSTDTLVLNDDIFTGAPEDYIIFQGGMSGSVNFGCALYVGIGGTLVITTKGGDNVTMLNVPDGTFIPMLVLRVLSATTASGILAIW
jgi:hypothetical protein